MLKVIFSFYEDGELIEKSCTICDKTCLVSCFNKAATKDGLDSKCKPCFAEIRKTYKKGTRKNHRKKINGIDHKKCGDCKKMKALDKYQKDRGRNDGHDSRCRDCKNTENRKRNKKPEIRKRKATYARNKRRSDPQFRLASNLRRRVGYALSAEGVRKTRGTFELTGCTPKKLKSHLENLFEDGMTWENYGQEGWHVDHIRPCSSFDLTNEEEQLECFHYTNLQPLWAEENWVKSDYWYPENDV